MENYELVCLFLSRFFNYEDYKEGIKRAKRALSNNSTTAENWRSIILIIRNRQLKVGEVLTLVHNCANQVLDENSDNEAYIWLERMIENIERNDGVIENY